jgi:DNA polymerase-3 subunit epsilon
MRQVVLDTETTGLDWKHGHRVIEIGCVEIINRRQTSQTYQQYVRPNREIDEAAQDIHGISLEMLADKPLFEEIADDFLKFVDGSELIIHNAPFDIGFLSYELGLCGYGEKRMDQACTVLDTLLLAREMHPGQRNSLDALCKRYSVDNTKRNVHGALLDARLLADVYLMMTGGQAGLDLGSSIDTEVIVGSAGLDYIDRDEELELAVVRPTPEELEAHEAYLDMIASSSEGGALWRKISKS